MILLAHSARALAASASLAGYAPLAIDVFGDADTRGMSDAVITLEGGLSAGLQLEKIAPAIKSFVRAFDPIGLVYGSGFEHQPEAISALAGIVRILGNAAPTLSRAKTPLWLAQFCKMNNVSHPAVALQPPEEPENWLVKMRGGAGGAHIRPAAPHDRATPENYFQRRVDGESVSALFAADGNGFSLLGLSEQWTAPAPAAPFRYGGAAGPAEVGDGVAAEILRILACLTRELKLVGLNSADFLVSNDAVHLIEINPRPGATLDVFESIEDPLLARHVAACEGRLTAPRPGSAFKAAQVVYAPSDMATRMQWEWPHWTADRPMPGTRINAGDPLCTVLASGGTVASARAHANERAPMVAELGKETAP
jgi:predicted ATP-grasp superfamily ATP-dependent carboligase